MSAPSYPIDEAERLLALQRTALLDTPPEERFDRITRLAAHFFGVPTCLVTLVDSDRQWFKSRVGLEHEQLGRDISFCGHAILDDDVFTVSDATRDIRFSANPLVTSDPHIRFYAGMPLREPSGQPIGTLCLIDSSARMFGDEQKSALRDFADMVEREIANLDQAEFQRKLSAGMTRMSSVIATMPDMVFVCDRQCRFLASGDHPGFLRSQHEVLGRTIEEVLPGEIGRELTAQVGQAFKTDEVVHLNRTLADTNQSFESRARKIDDSEVLVIIRDTTEQTRINAEVKRLSEVARQTTNGVIITDSKGLVVWINEAMTSITGYSLEDMLGKRPGGLLQGENTDPKTVEIMSKALANNTGFNVDVLNYSKRGKPYWMRVACNPLFDDSAQLQGFIAIQSDITKEKHDAALIHQSESLLRAVIDANTIGTWRLNMHTRELQINEKWATLLGYRRAELLPTDQNTWEKLTHSDDLNYCLTQLEKHATGQIPAYEANIRMKHKNGSWVWLNTRGRITSRTAAGAPEWLLGTHFDISAQVRAESTLQAQSKHMQAIVDNMLDGVISIDGKGVILTFNRAAEQMFGYSSDEIIGHEVDVLMSSPDSEQLGYGALVGRKQELDALHKDGTVFPAELGLAEVHQAEGVGFIGIVRDITQRRQVENEIRQLAFYDALTQLPNRRLLLDRIQQVLANCARQKQHAALLFLDLDNFKNLNDSAGHDKGDQLLCQVAQRLVKSVRKGDTVARLGGDEFVVVIEGLSGNENDAANQAEAAAEQIMDQLRMTFDLEGLAFSGSASIGVTMLDSASSSVADLLKQADMAMYKAKAAGRNAIQFFNPQMQIAVSLRAAMEQDLRSAIDLEQFQLHYQKQIDTRGQMVGAEVLLRWLHPANGLVSPAQFIPLAEETGLIVPIGEWVLRAACETLAQWSTNPAKSHLTIAVNMSVVQFNTANIVDRVLEILRVSAAPAHNLKLEITESLLASNFQDVKAKMLELQRHGVSFSIDDFGTGYSSLLYLKQLPINQLKIDQSFVRDIINSPNDRAIAQAVITLAAAMELNVIAEGVETEEQRALLQRLGCDRYQGYLYGKPCTLEELVI